MSDSHSFQVQVDPEDLIPKLPKPKDLQPFPITEAIVSHTRDLLLHVVGWSVG